MPVILIFSTFLLAGFVKGVIGLGLPTISLALLAATFDLPTAMALLIVPSLLTNLWQATVGGHLRYLSIRLWPFMLSAFLTIWFGALALTRINLSILSALLGVLLILYGIFSLYRFHFSIEQKHERATGTLAGIANGLLTGMTGSFVVPGVMYLQSIGLDRNQLVQAMGMLFSLSSLSLGLALQSHQLISVQSGYLSLIAVVPAILGMVMGQKVRNGLSELRFKQYFYSTLILFGIIITGRSI